MANEKERREDEIEIKKAVKELSINEIDEIMFSSPDSAADEEYEEEMEYKIVGSSEANSLKGKISNESPVGHALLGHKVGDEVTVETQAGEIHYKVLSIHRSN